MVVTAPGSVPETNPFRTEWGFGNSMALVDTIMMVVFVVNRFVVDRWSIFSIPTMGISMLSVPCFLPLGRHPGVLQWFELPFQKRRRLVVVVGGCWHGVVVYQPYCVVVPTLARRWIGWMIRPRIVSVV